MKITDVKVRLFKFPPSKVQRKAFFNSILLNKPPKERWMSITEVTTDEEIKGFWLGETRR